MMNAEKIQAWRDTHKGEQLTVEVLSDCLSVGDLRGADLRYADLRKANLAGVNLRNANLVSARLEGADLTGANLRGATLEHTFLEWAKLVGANLQGANLSCAHLTGADMGNVNLRGADLRAADLRKANLAGAPLMDACLQDADLTDANLDGVYLRRTNLAAAAGGVLQITGLYPYAATLIPTYLGWRLKIGCWEGTVDELRRLANRDEGWPEATGDEIKHRRPLLYAIIDMCETHMLHHYGLIQNLADKWDSDEAGEAEQ